MVAEPDSSLQMLRRGGDTAPNQILYFLPELYAVVHSMPVVPMELTILRIISFGGL